MKIQNPKSKIQKLLILIILSSLFLHLISLAGTYQIDGKTVTYQGLVPCGKSQPAPGESVEVTMSCQLCHLFVMITNIVSWALAYIILPIGFLMIVISGLMSFFTGGDPKKFEQTKTILTSAIIGLAIIFSAWILVSVFLNAIGVVHLENILTPWNISTFCPIK